MKAFNRFIHSVKILTITCVFLFFSTSIALAETCIAEGPVTIKDGSFKFTTTSNDGPAFTVRSALVSLPTGTSGTIDKITITGPDGEIEFGCGPIKDVVNGTNLIDSCGGPAVLKEGKTTYFAKGSNFPPETTVKNFSITLCDDF